MRCTLTRVLILPRRLCRPRQPGRACHWSPHSECYPTQDAVLGRQMDMRAGMAQSGPMRVVRWVLGVLATLVLVVLLLDTFGGYLFDGPLGPIPGGAFVGPVDPNARPDWSDLEKVIELEIRPAKPWSLSVWNVVIDGELYVPSAVGARRRWTAVALADPRVRVRTKGRIYERRIERVTDPELRRRVGQAVAQRYDATPPADPEQDTTWYFRLAPRA